MNVKEITLELNKLNNLIKNKAPKGRISYQCAYLRAIARGNNIPKLEDKVKSIWKQYNK